MPSKTTNVNPIPGFDGGLAPGHTDAQLQELRARTAPARRAQESNMPPPGAFQVGQDGPPQAGRVIDAQLAGRARDKRLSQLQASMQRYEAELNRPFPMMGGTVDPHLVDRRNSVQGVIDGIRIEMRELSGLDGDALVEYVTRANLVRFKQDGSAII